MAPRRTSRVALDRAALLYVGITLLLGIGSLHSQNNLLFIVFGVAVGVLLMNGGYAWSSLNRVDLRRRAPSHATAGQPITLHYDARTSARLFAAAALLIEETTAGSCAAVPVLTRAAPARASAAWTPEKRGIHRLPAFDVSTRFPFGAVKKTIRIHQGAEVLVRPAPVTPAAEAFQSAVTSGRLSALARPVPGAGEEFLGLREYIPGDPIRKVAWRASARHHRWVVREHTAPVAATVSLEVITDPALPESANEAAISLAAGTLELARRRGVVMTLAAGPHPDRPVRTLPAALDTLALLDVASPPMRPARPADLAVVAHASGPLLRPRRATAGAAR